MKVSFHLSLPALVSVVSLALPLSPILHAASAPVAPKETHAEAAKPATAAAALEAIRKLHVEITAKVKAKQLSDIHHLAETMTETASLLPGLSKALAADKLARVDGAVKNLTKALDALHDAADGNNQAATDKALVTVDSLMTVISAVYAPVAPAKN